MQAIVQPAYGTAEVLGLKDVELPTPRRHDVLVRVHAASVNRADWLLVTGQPYVMRVAVGLRRGRASPSADETWPARS